MLETRDRTRVSNGRMVGNKSSRTRDWWQLQIFARKWTGKSASQPDLVSHYQDYPLLIINEMFIHNYTGASLLFIEI